VPNLPRLISHCPRCRGGYYGVGPLCWAYCNSGFIDDGAFCRRPPADYWKSCCHYGTTGCRTRRWGICWSYHWVSSFSFMYARSSFVCLFAWHPSLSAIIPSKKSRVLHVAALDIESRMAPFTAFLPFNVCDRAGRIAMAAPLGSTTQAAPATALCTPTQRAPMVAARATMASTLTARPQVPGSHHN
jgi:hypothetical protein